MGLARTLDLKLSPDLEAYLQAKVESGGYSSVSEVIRESLRFLEQHEALMATPIAELQKRIAIGLEQADRGELLDGEDVFDELEERLASTSSG